MLSQENLILVLCEINSDCQDPKIYRWSIIKSPESIKIAFKRDTVNKGKVSIRSQSNAKQMNFFVNSSSALPLPNVNLHQSSFLEIVAFQNDGSLMMVYFSGSGDIQSSVCDDMVLNILKVND
jgi:hypothetical protein